MTEEDKQKQAIINKYLTFEVMGTVVTKTFPSNDPSDANSSTSTTNNTSKNADVPSDLNDTVHSNKATQETRLPHIRPY